MSISSVKTTYKALNPKDFTPEELQLIDIDGLGRTYTTITFNKLSDAEYFFMRDIAYNQYMLPIKYLKPIPNSYSYIAQKSQISGNEKDIKNASITIEPLNADFFNQISYTPINQSLPLGTVVTIDVENPFDSVNGQLPERKFIWSNNLETDSNVKSSLKGKRTKPWIECCHYGAIDIGSRLTAKYEVQQVDTEIMRSFSLFGFSRSDERKQFTIWTFNYFNVSPIDVLQLMKKQPKLSKDTGKIIDEILSKNK